MNRFVRFPIAFALALGVLASCAKIEPEDGSKLEKAAFDAWIQKYVLDRGVEAVEQSNGIYVEFFEDGNQAMDTARDTTVWLRLDYTERDIENNVFYTCDSLEALRQGSFTPQTYYAPEYNVCSPDINGGMTEGQYFALSNYLVKPDGSSIKLSEGSRVRIYMPSSMAYGIGGLSNNQGYGGQFPLEGNRIVIQDLEVRQIVKNPVKWEEDRVTELATRDWGLSETDTITTLFYVDTVNFRPNARLLADFPEKPFRPEYKLTADSTATIWFVGRFLPTDEYPEGFIFDTNIPSVYDEFYNRRKAQGYTAPEVVNQAIDITKPVNDKEREFIPAFYEAIPKLRRGQWSRIVFTSAYGWGATGMSKTMRDRQEELQMLANLVLSNNYYNNGMYGNNYYDNYYDNYYLDQMYYMQSMSRAMSEESEQQVITEIQPYTPIIFEIYIEADY